MSLLQQLWIHERVYVMRVDVKGMLGAKPFGVLSSLNSEAWHYAAESFHHSMYMCQPVTCTMGTNAATLFCQA